MANNRFTTRTIMTYKNETDTFIYEWNDTDPLARLVISVIISRQARNPTINLTSTEQLKLIEELFK